MHNQVHVRDHLVDFDQPVHLKHRAIRFARELVSTVTGTDRNRQSIHARLLDELSRLLRIRYMLQACTRDGRWLVFSPQQAILPFVRKAQVCTPSPALRAVNRLRRQRNEGVASYKLYRVR